MFDRGLVSADWKTNDYSAHDIIQLIVFSRTEFMPIVTIDTAVGNSPVRINGLEHKLVTNFDQLGKWLTGILGYRF